MIKGIDTVIIDIYLSLYKSVSKKSRNVIAISQYNSLDVDGDEAVSLIEKKYNPIDGKVNVYYHQFETTGVSDPYEPFLQFIVQQIKVQKIDVEELLQVCQVLPVQRDMFRSYFRQGVFIRQEMIIYNEYKYELEAINNSIFLMLKYITKRKPTLFIFNKFQFAMDTTVNLLNRLVRAGYKEMGFLLSYDNTYDVAPYMKEDWEQFLNILKEYDLIIEWQNEYFDKDKYEVFCEDADKIPEYYKKISNLKETLSFRQAFYYIEKIHNMIIREGDNIDIRIKYGIYGLATVVSIYADKIANAVLFCNEIKQLENSPGCTDELKMKIDFFSNYLLAYTQMYNEHEADANISAKRSIEIAKKIGNDRAVFVAELIEHMSRFSGWKDDVWFGECNEQVDEGLVAKVEKYGFINHLAHILVYAFDNDIALYKQVEGLEKRIYHWKKGIDLANRIHNFKFMLDGCKKAIMLASTSGYYEVSDYIYVNYSTPVVLRTNDIFEQANIYNGLGFNKSMEGSFRLANDYFNKALGVFIKDERYDYISETLYNMSINCVMANDFINGEEFVSAVIKILDKLKISMTRVCHLSKLYGIKAVCALMNGNMYTAKNYIEKEREYLLNVLEIDVDDPYMKYWRDDLFLYNYASLCIEIKRGNIENGKKFWDRAIKLPVNKSSTFEVLLFDCTTIEEFAEGFEKNKSEKTKNFLSMKNYKIEDIVETINNISVKIENEAMSNDLEFIESWKDLLKHLGTNTFLLVENAANSLKNTYNVTNFIVIQYSGNEPAVLYNDAHIYMDRERMNNITEYFEKNQSALYTSKFERGYEYHKGILDLFEGDTIASFYAVPFFDKGKLDFIVVTYSRIRNTWNRQGNRLKIYENNLKFYNIVFQELVDAIHRINDKIEIENKAVLETVNKKLRDMANIDRLTGLYNRQGLYYKIDEFVQKGVKDICVAYIDLDNFKYYNDSFGHDIGDIVLEKVAVALKNICTENDVAVRYGGDEFLILFNTDDCYEAARRVNKLYNEFKNNNYYINNISEVLKKTAEIPEKNRISCSIGVAKVCGNNIKEDISKAVTNADKTLYYIKRTTKGACKVWDDIKEIV